MNTRDTAVRVHSVRGVPKSNTVPVPALPVLETLRVFPYPCRTLITLLQSKSWGDVRHLLVIKYHAEQWFFSLYECGRTHLVIGNGMLATNKLNGVQLGCELWCHRLHKLGSIRCRASCRWLVICTNSRCEGVRSRNFGRSICQSSQPICINRIAEKRRRHWLIPER